MLTSSHCRSVSRMMEHGAPPSLVHFNAVCTDVNVVLREEPSPVTATMIAIEMPAAIRPYSIAVAPDSFRQRNDMNCDMESSLTVAHHGSTEVPLHLPFLLATSREYKVFFE